ncbi:hypothetical protein LTR37_012629 [Vermiconidia calcicola]|uniref:Uncharacterized protein n=1 Tax=Vermiconidia calcicola TaxID=1690605 RepID=A0ACC3MYS9_9PEZI|nr:hypothetical protein LTR37_012629 [Vermiconidia calcicola]
MPLFGSKKETQPVVEEPPRKSGNFFNRRQSSHSPTTTTTTTSQSNSHNFLHRDREDASITAARQRVTEAEASERAADKALMEARASVKAAREEVRRIEREAAEDARKAKLKQKAAEDISKRGKGLGPPEDSPQAETALVRATSTSRQPQTTPAPRRQSNYARFANHTQSSTVALSSSASASVTESSAQMMASSSADFLDALGDFLTSAVNVIESAFDDSSASATDASLSTSVSVAASNSASPTTGNALSALISALPSSIREPVQSQLDDLTATESSSRTSTAQRTTTSLTSKTRDHDRPTTDRGPGRRPTDDANPMHTPRPSTNSETSKATTTALTSRTSIPSTLSTTISPTTPPQEAAETAGGRPAIGANPIDNASVAGIASGLSAGAVLVALAGLFFYRRRKQGKPLFGKQGSQRSAGSGRVYPEVAWLYDPVMSRGDTPRHSRRNSGVDMIPTPRGGSAEMGTDSASPNLRPARPSSPLLAPRITISRDEGPSRSGRARTRTNSSADLRLPLRALSEEGA